MQMHIETVHIDRVFDVQGGMFSIEADGKRHYSVMFDHESVPCAGDTYAVALDAPGNWQTIAGWRNLGSGKVGLRPSPWAVATDFLFNMYIFGIIIPIAVLVFWGIWAALTSVVVMVLATGAIIRGAVLYNRKVSRALCAVPPAMQPVHIHVTRMSWRRRIVEGLPSFFF